MDAKAEVYRLYYAHIFAGIVEVVKRPGGASIRHFGCSTRFDISQNQLDELLRGAVRVETPKS